MQEQLDHHWNRGQHFETVRDLPSAQAEYEALLQLDGSHVPARLRVSRFEQFKGHYRLARRHALQAADAIRSGGSTRHVAHVTLRLLDFSEGVEVASVILSSDWSDPHVLAQSPMLAQHLWLAGRYEDALRFLDSVIPRLPPHPMLLFTRANVLRYLGRMDEAGMLYEQCLALRPASPDAHWAIATHSRAMPLDARIARLREARAHAAEGLEQAHLDYALFRELDGAGDPSAAWDALAEGARTMQGLISHDAQAETSRLQGMMRGQWLPPASSAIHAEQPIPVFIVGLPRTGTTLLDRMLGNHGWVTSAGERNDFSASVSEVADRFFTHMANVHDPEALLEADHRAIGHLYMQRLNQHASATALAIDKNPLNLFNLPLILRALPQAKILILERDAMDSAFSNLKELFQGGAHPYSYDFGELAAHVRISLQWIRYWAKAAPGAVHVVRYEDLVKDTEASMLAILDFLGLPYQQGIADITRNSTPVATASSSQVREPVNDRSMGGWRRYASQLEPLRLLMEDAGE